VTSAIASRSIVQVTNDMMMNGQGDDSDDLHLVTSPRRIRRKLELDNISPRTVDRCSQEGGLCGRVTRHNVIIRMMK